MDTIDLDAIIEDKIWKTRRRLQAGQTDDLKDAIHQALVLASEKAETTDDSAGNKMIDKQSILEIELLIK